MTANHTETLARTWAAADPLARYVDAAPDGPRPVADVVRDFLAEVDPFPAGARVETTHDEGTGWQAATIAERVAADEWAVDLDAGGRVFRDHTDLRPLDRWTAHAAALRLATHGLPLEAVAEARLYALAYLSDAVDDATMGAAIAAAEAHVRR